MRALRLPSGRTVRLHAASQELLHYVLVCTCNTSGRIHILYSQQPLALVGSRI